MTNDTNVTWHEHQVTRSSRESLNGHKGCVIWFTGLSGSGKSTIANALDHKLHQWGMHSVVLDGDNVRHSLNAGTSMLKGTHCEEFAQRFGLGFSAQLRSSSPRPASSG
jgi:adenylylsulfate kinase